MKAAQRVVAFGFWVGCVVLVTVLSLLPGPVAAELAPTALPDKLEHGVAYFLLTFMPGMIHSTTGKRGAAAGAMVLLGCVLEIAQMYSPGRGVEVLDAIANGAGAVTGWFTAEVLCVFLD